MNTAPDPAPISSHGEWDTGDFLAMLGHDLRTPIASMEGFLDLLADSPLTDEQRDMVETARDAAHDLRGILEGILECLRHGAGGIRLRPTPVNLRDFLGSILEKFRPQAARNHQTVALAMAEGMPEIWDFDAPRVRQILNNLLSNATKFSPGAEVVLEARVSATGGVILSVRDSGPGIPEPLLARVFEVFRPKDPGDNPTTGGGYGLGLAIVKKLAETMDGRLRIDSRPGRGTRVFVEFPWTQPPHGTSPPGNSR